MIPKIIHYAWLGPKRMPYRVRRCVKSFVGLHPDFAIKRWDASNFDFSACQYAKDAYDAKKWAFAADYLRLKVLYMFGGIWLDTDMKLLKRLDPLLKYKGFFATEQEHFVSAGIIGAEKGHPLIGTLLKIYEEKPFVLSEHLEDETIVKIITDVFIKQGWFDAVSGESHLPNGFELLPGQLFYPPRKRGGFAVTKDTYTIHYGMGSWLIPKERMKQKLINGCLVLLGPQQTEKLVRIKNGWKKHEQ